MSAVRDIEKVPGLRVVGVECDDMVTLAQIADRAGVSREAVRLWATGQRRQGGFPPPVVTTPAGEKIWDWQWVSGWLRDHNPPTRSLRVYTISSRTRTLCAADRVLEARAALEAESEETREELESLLQNA